MSGQWIKWESIYKSKNYTLSKWNILATEMWSGWKTMIDTMIYYMSRIRHSRWEGWNKPTSTTTAPSIVSIGLQFKHCKHSCTYTEIVPIARVNSRISWTELNVISVLSMPTAMGSQKKRRVQWSTEAREVGKLPFSKWAMESTLCSNPDEMVNNWTNVVIAQ